MPLFQEIASWNFDALDSGEWSAGEDDFNKALATLIRIHIKRLERRVGRSNEIAEKLLELSQNLPVIESKQESLSYPGVAIASVRMKTATTPDSGLVTVKSI